MSYLPSIVSFIFMISVFVFQAVGFIAIPLVIYSLISKNWKIWKYVGFMILASIILLIIGILSGQLFGFLSGTE